MAIDVTDATFETEVLARSDSEAVVIDLWAPWCGPCKMLGPVLEKVIDETEGVILCKVNVDENPKVSEAFAVQSIPAVYAVKARAVVDGFMGAVGEDKVREFANRLVSPPSEADLLAEEGDEHSLRKALELQPDHQEAIFRLAQLLIEQENPDEALEILARLPETAESRRLSAQARLVRSAETEILQDDRALDRRLEDLLTRVKQDESARQEFLDILESMESDDERRARYRKALSSRLF